MTPYEHIVFDVAHASSHRVVGNVVRSLQRIQITQSGDGSSLANAWDDICVQVQEEKSVLWDMYEQMIEVALEAELAKVTPFELAALWLDTPEGSDWSCTAEGKASRAAPSTPDVVSALKAKLCGRASDWSNVRIRAYLGGSRSDD